LFNKDGLFGRKDESPREPARAVNVNVTPDLDAREAPRQPAPQPAAARPERPRIEQPREPVAAGEPAGSRLIVGPDIKLKGVEITDCDTLVVEGRVEASMDSRVVQIAENGVFTGNATMDVAEIWGTFDGHLTARKQLVVYATGRVSGEIRYGRIRVEEGGELSGDVSRLAVPAAAPARAEPPRVEPARAESAAAPRVSPPPPAVNAPASQSPARPGATASR
jgi:cytoskeletal protein CcmA (bactofilin family)